jgi:hypothetical protein
MKFIERIKSLIKKSKPQQVETKINFEKQCPHCTSRGMFVFNNTSKIKPNIGESNAKRK